MSENEVSHSQFHSNIRLQHINANQNKPLFNDASDKQEHTDDIPYRIPSKN